jgi:hypothetical protein
MLAIAALALWTAFDPAVHSGGWTADRTIRGVLVGIGIFLASRWITRWLIVFTVAIAGWRAK